MKRFLAVAMLSIALFSSPALAHHYRHHFSHRHYAIASGGSFLPHPSGCPRIAFCACGAATEIFGRPIRALWLAAAWFKFPHSAPAPQTVAVRSHHVFVLRYHIDGDVWMVADYNSGGHLSRLHERSIAGFTIVSPTNRRISSL